MQEVTIRRTAEKRSVAWAGSATSNQIDIKGCGSALQLALPANFAGSKVSYVGSYDDGVTFVPVYSQGALVEDTIVAATAAINVLSALKLFGITKLKIVSDASETCVGTLLMAG